MAIWIASLVKRDLSRRGKWIVAISTTVVSLLPLAPFSIAEYVIAIQPVFSAGGLCLWLAVLWWQLGYKPLWTPRDRNIFCGWNLLLALVLYASALDGVAFDLYYYGYGFSSWFVFVAMLTIGLFLWRSPLAFVFLSYIIAFNLGSGHSQNFFDYIIDPVLALASLGILAFYCAEYPMKKKFMNKFECFAIPTMFLLILIGLMLRIFRNEIYRNIYIAEDGPIEWLQVIILASLMILCYWRFFKLRPHRPRLFNIFLLLFSVAMTFAVCEEISWGQRIFGFESPDFFKQHNAQKEFNFHNLVVNGVKINKLVFGLILGIAIACHLSVVSFFYGKKPWLKEFCDKRAIPIPRLVHIVGYLLLFLLAFAFPSSSKRGEMLELGGGTLFLCMFLQPRNAEIFRLKESAKDDE